MARKTKEEALETRQAILDAAERVFYERGVSQTTLADIAAAAGVTRGAIYWHFANKRDVYEALIQRLVDPIEARLTETLARDEGNPIDGLRAMALFVIDRVANDPRHSRMMAISWHKCEYVGEMSVIRDTHIECGARYLTLGEECFRKAIDRGYFPRDMDPHVASLGMMVIVDGLIATWTLYDDLFPLADYATRIMDAYLAGLQRPAGAPAGARIPPAAAGG